MWRRSSSLLQAKLSQGIEWVRNTMVGADRKVGKQGVRASAMDGGGVWWCIRDGEKDRFRVGLGE